MLRKKRILTVVCALAAAGSLFAGGTAQKGPAVTADGRPILTIGIETNAFITEYKDNYLTKYLEKLLGVELQFYEMPSSSADFRSKLSLMVTQPATMPDIIMGDFLSWESILDYGSKGAFIPLDNYLASASTAPHFYAIPEADRKAMLAAMTSSDGHIYHMTNWGPETWNLAPYRLYLNKAWLDKLGLKQPGTTEELRQTLIAFRDKDPNGNGKKDEIGITGFTSGGYGENTAVALINSFIFYNGPSFTLDSTGKKILAPFTQPDFRKALVYLNTLYKDGTFSASLFTNDRTQFRAQLDANPPVVGLVSAGSYGNWSNAGTDTNENFNQLIMVPPFKGPDGLAYSPYEPFSPTPSAYISANCKTPDLAFKLLDTMLEHTVSIIARYGEEGVDWSRSGSDLAKTTNAYVAMGLYPALTIVALKDIWSTPTNKTWHNQNPRYSSLDEGNTYASLLTPFNKNSKSAMTRGEHYKYNLEAHPRYVLPSRLPFTETEQGNITEAVTNIQTFVPQYIAEFTTGNRDINSDKEWESYLKELDKMGLQTWLQASQAAYDRMPK